MAANKAQKGFVHPKPNIHVFVPMEPITASTGHVISKNPQTERFVLKDASGLVVISTFSVADAKARVRIELEKKMLADGHPLEACQLALDSITYTDAAEVAAKAAALAKEAASASKQVELAAA